VTHNGHGFSPTVAAHALMHLPKTDIGDQMRYLILGAGALGGYFGAMLINGGADVTFLVRPTRGAQLKREGLVVKTQDGGARVKP